MNHIDTMKLGLEALEHMLEDAKQECLTVEYWNECVDAITALREALAQPQQEPVAWPKPVLTRPFQSDFENGHDAGWNARLEACKEASPQPAPVQGWKLVPVEPTPEMRKAAADAWLDCGSKMTLNKASAAVKAGIDAAPQPAQQQEPYGWHTEDHLTDRSATTYSKDVADRWKSKGWPVTPLYTSPQAQRKPWVGLTPEQRAAIAEANNMLVDDDLFDAIEAELKEKNT